MLCTIHNMWICSQYSNSTASCQECCTLPISLWHADNAMRPYVAFNAELRMAFQGCVTRMEEACAALARLVS